MCVWCFSVIIEEVGVFVNKNCVLCDSLSKKVLTYSPTSCIIPLYSQYGIKSCKALNIEKFKGRSSKMKIAKKVLAVVMAVAMIAALSAMAFAADKATIALKASEPADGIITVTLAVKNGQDFATSQVEPEFDATALEFVPATKKADFAQCKDFLDMAAAGNQTLLQPNTTEAAKGKIIVAFGFTEVLDDLAGYGLDSDINDFNIATMKFKVLKNDVDASIAVKGQVTIGDKENAKTHDIAETYVVAKSTVTGTTKAADVATTKAAEGEKTTKPANPNTGDQKTGDNMALAAAAGVVVLAGAAFIISKKRK